MHFRETSDSFAGSTRARSGRRVLLNITSLIDVMFLLLIFFAVSSTFLEQPGMKLDLPAAKSADLTQVKSAVLYLLADGSMRLNERTVSVEALPEELKTLLPQLADMSLSLFADKNVPHGNVVKVMDIARQSGVKKLVVATLPEANNP